MKFWEIFRFEIRYQLRTPWPWIFIGVLIVLNFLMTRDATLSQALLEEFLVNSPFAIAKTTVFGGLLWLVMAAFIAGDAAARDIAARMHPLIFTQPISKFEYLTGRFCAALLINALLLAMVQLAIALAIYSPGVDPSVIGPFRLGSYATAYCYIAFPTALVATSMQFAFALFSGRPIASYAASVALVFMGFFVASILLFKRGLGTLLDPIGIRFVVEDIAHLWTTVEKNNRLLTFDGIILENRLLWISIAILFLIVTYISFRFKHRVTLEWPILYRKIIHKKADPTNVAPENFKFQISNVKSTYGLKFHTLQTLTIALTSFKSLALSLPGLTLLFGIPLLCIPIVIDQMETNSGQVVPTTIRVVRELTSPLSNELSRWVIIPAFIIFFSGELIWREREARVHEIIDTIAGSNWTRLIGKWLGLVLILVVFTFMQMLAGILAQVALDYSNFETTLYFKIMFGFQLIEYALFALLTLAIHAVVDQKYFGHLIAMLVYVFMVLSTLFGIQHNMLVFGASPAWSYTDMRGFGNSVAPWIWFKLYWAAWTLGFAVVAKMLWVRGANKKVSIRLRAAVNELTSSTKWTAIFATALVIGCGGFVFYNTNILNEYISESELKERQAEYEHRYGKFRNIAQPNITKANLTIEIYNHDKRVHVKGHYTLVNLDSTAIDSIHVATAAKINTEVNFDQATQLQIHDEKLNYSIYRLAKPLQPGDSINLSFDLHVHQHGFAASGASNSIESNGTRFSNSWFPTIGYREDRELIHAADRREYKLAERPVIASLYDSDARKQTGTGIRLEVTMGTDAEQSAGAPGKLIQRWNKADRNYFHYKTDGAIGHEWTFFSAKYSLHEEKWLSRDSKQSDVSILIFHAPEHTTHLQRMLETIRSSLRYYSDNFGPYPHNHLTIAEIAGEGTGLHADATMLTYSEGFSLWNPENSSIGFDFPSAVIAHEMAHQWTVPYANVEGAPVMSESVAWYYGMKLVEHTKGEDHLRALLHDMRQPHPYPPIRRGEPLLRGLDPYLSYRRGPFALYTLSEYVGEKNINHALRSLLEKHRDPGARLATTLDLYNELTAVTPDTLDYLLHDLFEVNTYWNFAVRDAKATRTEKEKWRLTFEINAQKIASDSAGVETEVAMNDWIEIGVLGEDGKSIYSQKHKVESGKQKMTIVLEHKPLKVGVDPNRLMISLKPPNNFSDVKY